MRIAARTSGRERRRKMRIGSKIASRLTFYLVIMWGSATSRVITP